MKNKPHFFLLPILLMLFGSCEKELDFKYHDIPALPVIEAELTPEGAKVALTMTTPMADPMDLTRYTDAQITLTDLDSSRIEFLSPDDSGYFVNPTPGIPGHHYRLDVEWNDKKYSATTLMYPSTQILSLEFQWINMPYDQVAVFQAQFEDDATTMGDCYWVKLFRNGKSYCWMELDDRGAVDGVGTCMTLTTRRDLSEEEEPSIIEEGDLIDVTICRISREMHDYLEALQNDSNGPAMFEGDKCLGYFMATSPVSDSLIFHPTE